MGPNSRHLALLCNPVAGNGKAIELAGKISKALEGRKISYQVFADQWPVDLNRFSDLVIIGGMGR
jgi:hypothetical protein